MDDMRFDKILDHAKQDTEVLAVILFGSLARGEAKAESDVDICLVLAEGIYAPVDLSRKKLRYLQFEGLDVHVYQQLPLYVRRRVLRDGRVLFVRNEDHLYEIAFRTAQAFEDYKHRYYDYLEKVADAGS
jgi:uncharacterized protein